MPQLRKVIDAGLAILSKLNNHRNPNTSDISLLESYVGPKPSHLSLDLWVCQAIISASKELRKPGKEPPGH